MTITRKWRVGLAVSVLGLAPLVHAASGDAQRGKTIAQQGTHSGAAACTACHGLSGEGNATAGYPALAGLDATYLVHQLASFKQGTRTSLVMQPIAKGLNEQQMADVSAWYAQQSLHTAPSAKADASSVQRGAQLARVGAWDQGVPACASCHGPAGEGVAPHFPRLAGQYANYLTAQLQAFQSNARRNDENELMRSVARHLSPADMQAVATYFAQGAPASVNGGEQTQASSGKAASSGAAQGKPGAKDRPPSAPSGFTPPPESAIPNDEFGKVVRLGRDIFVDTQTHAKQYVGNGLNCANCHLDRGRKPDSAPMWAAYVYYPAYRDKNKKVNTMQDRIQGCFHFSENGTPPAVDSKEMTALVTYFSWLAQGAPSGTKMKEHNYPKLAKAAQEPDKGRGAKVYAQQCAYCHGDQGQGALVSGRYAFPPLWGPKSFNWGAGMHKVETAAAFVKHNMPLGRGGSLSDQDAWDVAAFVDSHPRPPDPRKLKPGQSRQQAVAGP